MLNYLKCRFFLIKNMKECNYNLEIEKTIELIKKNDPKKVCLQFADGLKPYSKEIYDKLKEEFSNIEFYIWGGTCYGACDTPIVLKNYNFDLTIQFGHSSWK